jgi:hypothetical protein
MILVIFAGNIVLWLIFAVTTGHEYEHLFPTIALFPGAFLCGVLLNSCSYIKCVGITIVSAVAADLIWIIYEISLIDPTSHNLAPFELIAAGLFAIIPGAIGGGTGRLLQRFVRREKG